MGSKDLVRTNTKVRKYSRLYYHARRLFFQPSVAFPNKVVRTYSSGQISRTIAKEFNVNIPASTVRKWSITPDKDFWGLSWLQEWDRRMEIGREQLFSCEHLTEDDYSSDSQGVTGISAMEKLSEMRKCSILNDPELVGGIGELVLMLARETEAEYMRTGKVNRNALKLLQPFHTAAKAQLSEEIAVLRELKSKVEAEDRYGKHVSLKDPQARERVRLAMHAMMNLALDNHKSKTSTEETQKDEAECEGTFSKSKIVISLFPCIY